MAAAIREIEEETGYKVAPENLQLVAVGKLEGGYQEDWVMCFFKANVSTKNIPKDNKTEDGELIWLNKDKVLDSEYELVDDLNYCFKDIVEGKSIVFFTAKVGDDQRITGVNISKQVLE
jgi:8-oxo-dGTP pyrophosphatase MutT (NUDIX family)